ncbi:hypothetical protein Lal_00026442 [Lupinus albus]|nr:hypothetical protein Lal_00026442 [Lupinus albus]
MSPCEACWKIFSFSIHGRSPAVERLYVHLENEHSVIFDDSEVIDDILSKTTVKHSIFTSWMDAKKNMLFVYISGNRFWKSRKLGYTIGILIWVPPSTGELFYLRMMLTSIKGPCNYEEIRTVNNVIYPTFREACFAMGFLEDDRNYIEAIKESNEWGSASIIQNMYGNKHDKLLADDIRYEKIKEGCPTLKQNLALLEIENLLKKYKSLRDYPSMPYPKGRITIQLGNRLIYVERDYDKE